MGKINAPLWELEEAAFEKGFAVVCGCDEAGAGPLARLRCRSAGRLKLGIPVLRRRLAGRSWSVTARAASRLAPAG